MLCWADINPESAQLRRNFGFYNDPDLIYFRPKTPHSQLKMRDDSIVIAVPREKVRVFNQEERPRRNFRHYCGRSMAVEEYDELMSKIKSGQCLNGDKRIVSLDTPDSELYIPEVCFDGKYIPPEYFVKH